MAKTTRTILKKYGQKPLCSGGARSYYRCRHPGCGFKAIVDRNIDGATLVRRQGDASPSCTDSHEIPMASNHKVQEVSALMELDAIQRLRSHGPPQTFLTDAKLDDANRIMHCSPFCTQQGIWKLLDGNAAIGQSLWMFLPPANRESKWRLAKLYRAARSGKQETEFIECICGKEQQRIALAVTVNAIRAHGEIIMFCHSVLDVTVRREK